MFFINLDYFEIRYTNPIFFRQKQSQLCLVFSVISHTNIDFAVHTFCQHVIPISEKLPPGHNASVIYNLWSILFCSLQFRQSSCRISHKYCMLFHMICMSWRLLTNCEYIRVCYATQGHHSKFPSSVVARKKRWDKHLSGICSFIMSKWSSCRYICSDVSWKLHAIVGWDKNQQVKPAIVLESRVATRPFECYYRSNCRSKMLDTWPIWCWTNLPLTRRHDVGPHGGGQWSCRSTIMLTCNLVSSR